MLKTFKTKLFTGALALAAFASMGDAHAQRGPDRGFPGRPIEIIIGGGRQDRSDDRIERLERAVHQLQRRVYQLEDSTPSGVWACSLTDDFSGTHFGRGRSKVEAAAVARSACERQRNAMFCQKPARCEQE